MIKPDFDATRWHPVGKIIGFQSLERGKATDFPAGKCGHRPIVAVQPFE
jgi:hypothetical protein